MKKKIPKKLLTILIICIVAFILGQLLVPIIIKAIFI